MSNVDIRAAIIKAIKATLALDDNYIVQDEQQLCDNLGADSLDIRMIGLDIEDSCSIDISDSDLYGVKTVGQLVDLAVRLHREVQP